MYGCRIHHDLRKAVIEKYGERDGWEPFGQWSLQKAREIAKQESLLLGKDGNRRRSDSTEASEGGTDLADEDSSSSEGSGTCITLGQKKTASMCMNGKCAWKVRSAYDDVYYEINGRTESETEDNAEC